MPRFSPRFTPALFAAALCLSGCVAVASLAPSASEGRPLTYPELMQFRQIRGAAISADGTWIGYALVPDRGDGEVVFRATEGEAEHRVERGSAPQVSADGAWGVAAIQPSFEEKERARESEEDDEAPEPGLAIVALASGDQEKLERVEAYALSRDGRWLAYRHHAAEEDDAESEEDTPPEESASEMEGTPEPGAGEEESEDEEEPLEDPDVGSTLHLRDLTTGAERVQEHVLHFAFDELSTVLVFDVSAPEGAGNGLFAFPLSPDAERLAVHEIELGVYSHLTWAHERTRLAFLAATFDRAEGEPGEAELWTWDGAGAARRVTRPGDRPEGHVLPAKNELAFSRDGERLFFGFQPEREDRDTEDDDDDAPFDPYDVDAILEECGVDVWHWNDPWISPNQKKRWEETEKDRVYRAVAHLADGRIFPLADVDLPDVRAGDCPTAALGSSDLPYRKEVTWDGTYVDFYLVGLDDGARQLISPRLSGGSARAAQLSPSGRYVSYYRDGDWHLFDGEAGASRNVTGSLGVPFANEDHDYPSDPPGYGQGEWLADDSAVLLYDKFDVWQVFTDEREALRLTAGREEELVHRVVDRDPDTDSLAPGAELLLRAYADKEKHDAFVSATLGAAGTEPLYGTGEHRLRFLRQAEDADDALFTRERYDEFPDLWVTDFDSAPRRLTDANPQLGEFAWGQAELVEWSSLDGKPLQGVLIKPGNYEEGRRYPVLVYYYRFFSQRLHEFNEPVINHRPSFPMYASNGYAVFLPDIRFDIGQPGFSATKCLVPGVQKLIDSGIADPDAIGLHGHSWSGYQTAFVITQTDIFKAAVAGAPVSNMTSAYSGIRWGTGLARQFQYEKSQSRIGGSLWETPERYIENSPVFYADRIETPLLIEFGDEDEAVPWYQGIELYLACRRLGKECIFLQYRGEPHHLKKYGNKLDYSIKMMEYFDHHLKGAEAPAWMVEGVPYRGE